MADPFRWRIPHSVISQLAGISALPPNELSIFSEPQLKVDKVITTDTEPLRKAGVLDALGRLSPVFQRTLQLLVSPEAFLKVQTLDEQSRYQLIHYFSTGMSHSVQVIDMDEILEISDPADPDEMVNILKDWMGSSLMSGCEIDIHLPYIEALALSVLIDLQRKAAAQAFSNSAPVTQTFSNLHAINQHLTQADNPQQWLSSIIRKQLSSTPELTEITLQSLVKIGLAIQQDTSYSVSSSAARLANSLIIASQAVVMSKARRFGSERVVFLNEFILQGGLNILLKIYLQDNQVFFKCLSSRMLHEQILNSLKGGLPEISAPTPPPIMSTVMMGGIPGRITWKLNPKQAGVPIHVMGSLRIGRSPDNQVVISEPSVSRIHSQVEIRENECWVTDLNSSNGTFVNGKRITQPYKLTNGEVLQIGPNSYDVTSESISSGLAPSAPAVENAVSTRGLTCPRCGAAVRQEMRFCDQCGLALH
jgi:pSer/pThr/pTyr-binding forkhead associated (FHA) protein